MASTISMKIILKFTKHNTYKTVWHSWQYFTYIDILTILHNWYNVNKTTLSRFYFYFYKTEKRWHFDRMVWYNLFWDQIAPLFSFQLKGQNVTLIGFIFYMFSILKQQQILNIEIDFRMKYLFLLFDSK